jgi:putative ATPase
VLVAATTENPSFSVISPLLSRSLLIELQSLTEAEILEVLNRAVFAEQGLASKFSISADVLGEITRMSGGDARKALTILEAAASASSANGEATEANSARSKKTQKTNNQPSQIEITREAVELATDRVFVAYDKSGDQHYDVISAFIKSIRGSDADAAVHYLARMLEGGEDPRFIARRLIILASEDVGLADPNATQVAVAAFNAVALVGMPEGRIPLANATIYLALAPKSVPIGKIPTPLRSSNYVGAKKRGLGQGYLYPHDDTRAVVEQQYLSRELLSKTYYRPKAVGHERELGERWSRLRTIIRAFKLTK